MYYVTLSNISWNLFLWKTGKSKSSLVAQMVKNPPAMQEISPWVRKIPWRREGLPIPVFLPGKSHGREPGGLQSMGSQSQTQLLPVFISWGCHEKWPQSWWHEKRAERPPHHSGDRKSEIRASSIHTPSKGCWKNPSSLLVALFGDPATICAPQVCLYPSSIYAFPVSLRPFLSPTKSLSWELGPIRIQYATFLCVCKALIFK